MNTGTHRGFRAVRQFMESYDESVRELSGRAGAVPRGGRPGRSRSSDGLGGDSESGVEIETPRLSTS